MTVKTPCSPYRDTILCIVISFSGIVIVKNQCLTSRSFRIFQNISGFDHSSNSLLMAVAPALFNISLHSENSRGVVPYRSEISSFSSLLNGFRQVDSCMATAPFCFTTRNISSSTFCELSGMPTAHSLITTSKELSEKGNF